MSDQHTKTDETPAGAASALSAGLGALPTMADALAAGDGVLLNEQAALLRECRLALDDLLRQKPMMTGLLCGSTTLGNLRAELYAYRPQGVFNGQAPTLELRGRAAVPLERVVMQRPGGAQLETEYDDRH